MFYCDDARCPFFTGDACRLGISLKFKVPNSYQDIMVYPPNWGYKPSKECHEKKIYLQKVAIGE